MKKFNIVVIGTSAGGMDALRKLLGQLPRNFAAPIFVVRHAPASSDVGVLIDLVNEHTQLKCQSARHGDEIAPGKVYVAPADNHIMVGKGRILITKGAQENRFRPAIDPLFRSAAVAYGNRVIAVLLTGGLDDGTAGLIVVKRCGGTCVVQDPKDALFPDMPANALRQVQVDHCVTLAEMGALLITLAKEKAGKRTPVPPDIKIEAKIAERVLSDLKSVDALGDQVPFNCPACGGVLWQVGSGKSLRYRCHTGHAFTAPALFTTQSEKVEETLWVALRMFEERRNLLFRMSESQSSGHSSSTAERLKDSEVHIERIKEMLKANQQALQ
jgi:two-component system, chemotaxis family, protein-glutamate methylesterase/glutaminase